MPLLSDTTSALPPRPVCKPASIKIQLLFSMNVTYRSTEIPRANRVPIFLCLRHCRQSIQIWHPAQIVITRQYFHFERLLHPCQISKLEDHLLRGVSNCAFRGFAVTLPIWRPSHLCTTWEHAMSIWVWVHLTRTNFYLPSFESFEM
jgi:hypothetical protein